MAPPFDSEQALPTVPVLDPKPAWLTIAPLQRVTQGPVTFPASLIPMAVPIESSPIPITEMVRDKIEVTVPLVVPLAPFVPVRPLKQDRN
jgi:hypothetical protein